MSWLLFAVVLFLAWSNGANDNFKGVATLYGSGTTSYKKALALASAATLAGALLTLFLAAELVKTFSARGLVPDETAAAPVFLAATALAAGATVLVATVLGLPVSTTHALIGALLGAGFAAGNGVNTAVLGRTFVLPLLLSPALSATISSGLYPLARRARIALGIHKQSCVCIGQEMVPIATATTGALASAVATQRVRLALAAGNTCVERYEGAFIGVSANQAAGAMHFLSAGAVCFARALNDTPKIVGILLGAKAIGADVGLASVGLASVGLAMTIGGLFGARKVAETMAKKIVPLNAGQGLIANLTTAGLVLFASSFGLPVSTTHVATGSLFGIGTVTRTAKWKTVATIWLAWLTTLPLGAALGALALVLLR